MLKTVFKQSNFSVESNLSVPYSTKSINIRYQIGGKLFAAVCFDSANNPKYITLKLKPEEGDFLRQQYTDIIPGYYMNKIHWNSVKADGEVPDEILKDMLDKSYQLVLSSFSRKKQKEILS